MTKILINTGIEVKAQQYAPHIKGINSAISCPKDKEIIVADGCKIRKGTDIDVMVINNLSHNPIAQIEYFNTL